LEVAPVKLFYLVERPSVLLTACAPAHASGVGYLSVEAVSPRHWRSTTDRSVTPIQLSQQEKSVQLQVSQTPFVGINGLTAKVTGMADALAPSAKARGVPPRGKPV
jgi:hypothetical protein